MVEVEVGKSYPDKIYFEDENSQEVTVLVEYDWLPIKCLKCKGVGHKDVQCRGRTRAVRKRAVANQTGPKQVWRRRLHLIGIWIQKSFLSRNLLLTPLKKLAAELVDKGGGEVAGLLWKSHQIHVDVLAMAAQFIHFRVKDRVDDLEFLATYVYGFNKIEERVPLWDALMGWNIVDPWVVLGDFNNVLYSNERIGKTNKQPTDTRVYSRIDRVFVNSAWVTALPDYFAYFAPEGYFDLCPCIVDCESVTLTRRKPFKFCNMWSKIGKYKDVVKGGWSYDVQGTPMFRVVRKLKNLKASLKQLNRHLFSDIERNTDIAYTALIECQKQLQNYPRNTDLMDVKYQSRASYLMLPQARDDFPRQKAKVQWAKDGDANTAMFHRVIQQRQLQNKVIRIEDAEGKSCSSPEHILEAFVAYYKDLLGSTSANSGFYPHIIDKGEKVHTADWDKLCEIPYSDEINRVIFSIAEEKSPGPDGYSSCFYKSSWAIIQGDICKAVQGFFQSGELLDGVLPYLINPTQSAFIKGRNSSPRCMMKVDLRKAYNFIEWEFIGHMLASLKFPQRFIGWVMQCVTTSSYSIVLNGQPHGFFPWKKRTTARGDLRFVFTIMEVFNCFTGASTLHISSDKSDIILNGIDQSTEAAILEYTGFKKGSLPFKYLGVKISQRRLCKGDCNILVDRMIKRIRG
ncbi:uncharacterized protein LOC141618622 [Silene latifolia]|uniref:uncharacterized protein LOC141618622 n=1 Tax=Silene latifolia TaxID=37657 RepID=UPI003D77C8EE